IAKPTSRPVRFVVATARPLRTPRSISGSSTRDSTQTQITISAAPPANRPIVRAEPQPQSFASVTASSTAASAADRTAAPTQSMRIRLDSGDAGTRRCAASAAGSAIRLIQNSHSTPIPSAITPESGSPMPAPMPRIALTSPRPLATLSGGNVSRMIPNASGNTPPATPWITRPRISNAIECARAHTTPPTENSSSTSVRTRPLPYTSPSLPTIGVETEADSRKPLRIHDAAAGLASTLALMSGSAGITSVCDSANETPAIRRTTSTPTGCFTGTVGSTDASPLIETKLAAAFPSSASVAQPRRYPVHRQEQRTGEVRVGFPTGSAVRAPALRERNLEVVDRGEVVVAHAQRALQHGVVAEQLVLAAEAEQLGQRQLVLGSDFVEEPLHLRRYEALHVVPGDLEVRLGERHRHVREEVAEEVPVLVHLGEPLAEAGLARRRQAAPHAEPARHDLA